MRGYIGPNDNSEEFDKYYEDYYFVFDNYHIKIEFNRLALRDIWIGYGRKKKNGFGKEIFYLF